MRISQLAVVLLLVSACIGGSSAYNSTLGWQTLNSAYYPSISSLSYPSLLACSLTRND